MSGATAWPPERVARLLARLALALFLVALALGLVLPVYTDEIGWRFQERAGLDGGLDIMMNDLCGPHTLARAPWFMMPVRWFSAVTNQLLASPLLVRATGIVCALGWTAMLWRLIGRLAGDDLQANRLRALALALLALGLLPLLLVMSRPEQPIILAATLSILLTFAPLPALGPRAAAWLRVVAIVLLACVAASYHVKGVLYAGVSLGCLILCARGRQTLAPRLVGIAALVVMDLAAAHYWIARFQCPGDPVLAAMLARENVAALVASGDGIGGLILQLLQGANPLNYVYLAAPTQEPMSHWVPAYQFTLRPSIGFAIGMELIWLGTGLLALFAAARFIRARRFSALLEPRLLVGLAILGCTSLWGASQLNRNVYEAAHMLPMLVVCLMLFLTLPSDPPPPDRTGRILPWLAGGVLLFAGLGQVMVYAKIARPMIAAARTPGYLDKQPFSVSLAGYGGIKQDIDRAMARSGMPRDRRLRRLLVDDLTYLPLQTSYLPMHRLGVLEIWTGSITDPVAYLRSRGSDGVVLGCRFLPAAMRRVAAQSGEICAISRAGLDRAAAMTQGWVKPVPRRVATAKP